MADTTTDVAAIEAFLEAEWHTDQCGCASWPSSCVGLDRPFPPCTWTVEAVLNAQRAVQGNTPEQPRQEPIDA